MVGIGPISFGLVNISVAKWVTLLSVSVYQYISISLVSYVRNWLNICKFLEKSINLHISHFLYVQSKNNRSLNFRFGQNAPEGHAHLRWAILAISASDCRIPLNMGCKMTAIIKFVGTQGILETLSPSVLEIFAKN